MSVVIDKRDLNVEQKNWLAEKLTIKTKVSRFQQMKLYAKPPAPFHFYVSGKNTVRVPYSTANTLFGHNVNSKRDYPKISLKWNPIKKLYNTQYQDQEIVAKEAIKQLNKHGTTSLVVYTGFGKTVVSTYLACKIGLLPFVLIEGTTLIKQWKETFQTFTNGSVWIVGEKCDLTKPVDVIVCMYKRIHKVPDAYLKSVGVLIIDEAHKFCSPDKVGALLRTSPKYVISATATLDRRDGKHKMIQEICGEHRITRLNQKPWIMYRFRTKIKYEITQQTPKGPKENSISPTGAHIAVIRRNEKGGEEGKWNALVRALCNTDKRNGYLLGFVMRNLKYKILILTRSVPHVKMIYGWLQHLKIDSDWMCGTKKKYKDSNVLVGTVPKLGTGFDEATFCESFSGIKLDLLILPVSIGNPNLVKQTVGRVLRAQYPQVIYFVDSIRMIQAHWRSSKKWAESETGIIMELEPPNGDEQMPILENPEDIISSNGYRVQSTSTKSTNEDKNTNSVTLALLKKHQNK